MRVLSFSQPWLWAILHAGKRVENRKWAPPIHMIDQRIALHAALSWDNDAVGFLMRFGIEIPGRFDSYPKGQIVGVATIDRVVTEVRTLTWDQARWFFGPFGWLFTDVRELTEPIEAKGGLGLRELGAERSREVEARICDQVLV